jgi:hypothetical protein
MMSAEASGGADAIMASTCFFISGVSAGFGVYNFERIAGVTGVNGPNRVSFAPGIPSAESLPVTFTSIPPFFYCVDKASSARSSVKMVMRRPEFDRKIFIGPLRWLEVSRAE